MKTKDFRSLHSQAQEDLRMKAVKAVVEGKTRMEVARIFGVTRESVGAWVKRYKEGGRKVLKARRRGRPKGG
ncbi:MAG TPA: helix-turn-helix domain-containing protein, partial [Nitrospirae bacterium]|nr:helix-turn-helix domain-containing protein [Nitrospirota bacterium]